MSTTVKNQEFVDLMRQMGYNLPPDFDSRGAQHGEFKSRIIQWMVNLPPDQVPPHNVLDIYRDAEGAFNRLDHILKASHGIKTVGMNGQTIDSTNDPAAMAFGALRAAGVDEATMLKIINATEGQAKTSGFRQAGKKYSDMDVVNGVQQILGRDNPLWNSILHTAYPTSVNPQGQTPAQQGAPPPTGPTPLAPAPPPPATTPTTPTAPPKAPGGTGTGKGTTPPAGGAGGAVDRGLPAGASDAQVIEYFKKNYGADAWMMQIPGFTDIARKIATGGGAQWSPEMIKSAVQATPWWQQNGENVFNFMQAQNTNARGLNDQILSKQKQLDQKSSQYGLFLTPERNLQIATDWQKFGWDTDTLDGVLAGELHYQSNRPSTFTDNIKTQAKGQLVHLSDDQIQQWGQKLIANPQAGNDFAEFLKGQAKSMFPSFSDRLDGGETMKDISSSYAKIAANTLEMDENDVDFTNPKWMKALDTVDPKTGQHTSMSYADWANTLKSDPQYRYDYTNNAKQDAMGMATSILQKFGAIASGGMR